MIRSIASLAVVLLAGWAEASIAADAAAVLVSKAWCAPRQIQYVGNRAVDHISRMRFAADHTFYQDSRLVFGDEPDRETMHSSGRWQINERGEIVIGRNPVTIATGSGGRTVLHFAGTQWSACQ